MDRASTKVKTKRLNPKYCKATGEQDGGRVLVGNLFSGNEI